MIVALLGLLDIFTAFALLHPVFGFIFYLGVFYLIKAALSFVGSFASGYYFEWMGLIDLLTGLCLIFAFEIPFLWLALALKGLFSALTGW